LILCDEIGDHRIPTSYLPVLAGYQHPEYVTLAAEKEVDFVANHDFGQQHSIFVQKPPSCRGLIGEAVVDLRNRRVGERLADALDKIAPDRGEHAAETLGDSRKARHQNGRNAQFAGDFDGMYWTGAAEGGRPDRHSVRNCAC
jgi:hypothetical protein